MAKVGKNPETAKRFRDFLLKFNKYGIIFVPLQAYQIVIIMICHKSHAQEILASNIDGNSTSEYIRKLALDIEQIRTVCERLAKRNEDSQDDIEALKDKLLDVKIHCYVLQFFLIVTIAVVCCLILKQV